MSEAAGTGLAGRIALVSGGGRGVGRGISEELAAAGAAVAVVYNRDADAAEETAKAIVGPADVGRVVRVLVSEGAGYVTGQQVEVDGGGSRR